MGWGRGGGNLARVWLGKTNLGKHKMAGKVGEGLVWRPAEYGEEPLGHLAEDLVLRVEHQVST